MNKDPNTLHIPVMTIESIEHLNLNVGDTVVDCTVNRASHALEIAKVIGESGVLIIFDLDLDALNAAKVKLEEGRKTNKNFPKIISIHSNYRNLEEKLAENNIYKIDALLADLGLSSQELEISGRGFSFQRDEPLLMTFQSEIKEATLTAKDLINDLTAVELGNIFKNYGDEVKYKKIAEKIVSAREEFKKEGKQIETTGQLVEIIILAVGQKPWIKTHPATKVFQALRIAVNDEYDSIREMLDSAHKLLKDKGKMCIITFHGGEDSIVKHKFNEYKKDKNSKLTKKIKPSSKEIMENRRSRSAILRILEK